jgi:manganese/zinc/iron transport system permease protein
MLVIATLFGAFSAFMGSYVSYIAPSMPTGPWVVMVLSILTVGSIWFAPKKGMLARYKIRLENQNKILTENILKLFYHRGEKDNSFKKARSFDELLSSRDFTIKELSRGLDKLKKKNMVRKKDQAWYITQLGLNEAKRIIRLHRLWEMYLNQRLNLEPDHVHNDAEAIEHIITPEVEKQLERDLAYPEKDPHQSKIPYNEK